MAARVLACWRATTRAVCVESDALIWMTPPPGPLLRHDSGSPSRSTSQSRTWASISVAAGLVAHNMPCWPRPAATSSASTDGSEAFAGK